MLRINNVLNILMYTTRYTPVFVVTRILQNTYVLWSSPSSRELRAWSALTWIPTDT